MNIENVPLINGRPISGVEQEILERMRNQTKEWVRRACPKSLDGGGTEIYEALKAVGEMDADLMKKINAKMKADSTIMFGGMTQSEMEAFVFNEVFSWYNTLTEDQRALTWTLREAEEFRQRHGLRGLPENPDNIKTL